MTLLLALLSAVTLPNGDFVRHCREAPLGCVSRVSDFAGYFAHAGRVHGVDPLLLAAIAVKESRLNPHAVGARGERSIMQIHPRFHPRFDACDDEIGACQSAPIHYAAKMLSEAIDECGSEAAALGRYNRGTCGVTRYSLHVFRIRETLR